MTDGRGSDERLAEAFRALGGADATEVPDDLRERIWLAVSGALPPEERQELVERTAADPACAEAWRIASELWQASQAVADEGAVSARVYPERSQRAWLMGLTGWRQAALLAAAALLLCVLPSALLIVEIGRSRGHVDRANLAAADWQRRYEESRRAAREAEQARRALAEELSRQRGEIDSERERDRQARLAEDGQRQAPLQPTAPIFALNIVRGRNTGPSAPATQIAIPRSARWIVLKLDIEPNPELQSYRATLLRSGRVICRASDVVAINEALAISCDSSLFEPGDYQLTLEGLTHQDRQVPAGTYAFRVIR